MTKPPLIFGHRGARKYAPENSISSFKKAIELKLDGVEFDVMSTSDGVPVVVHDDNLDRLSGKHIHLHKTPFVDIQKLDIGRSFSPFFGGEKIPTLKEVLKLFENSNMFLNIEIKKQSHQHKNFLKNVVETIENSPLKNKVTISSFNREILYQIGRIAPQINRSLLLHPKAFFFLDVIFFANILCVCGINPHISRLNKRMISYARLKNLKVMVWTPNEPKDIRKAINLGVDAIISDEPALVKEMVKEHYAK